MILFRAFGFQGATIMNFEIPLIGLTVKYGAAEFM
jgi:hypothetical protein